MVYTILQDEITWIRREESSRENTEYPDPKKRILPTSPSSDDRERESILTVIVIRGYHDILLTVHMRKISSNMRTDSRLSDGSCHSYDIGLMASDEGTCEKCEKCEKYFVHGYMLRKEAGKSRKNSISNEIWFSCF